MGNLVSSNKCQHPHHNEVGSTFSATTTKIPKHLQPLKRKHTSKKTRKSSTASNTEAISPVAAAVAKAKAGATPNSATATMAEQQDNNKDTTYQSHLKTLQVNPDNEINQIFMDHHHSNSGGPQLFKWTKGRRYQNTDVSDSDHDLNYPLPNDQTELDRHRVQTYVLRWAFESRHIVPPMIQQQLFEGIKVLDVGCGPGLWLGHPILDMAQDFYKSCFDAVNICNLLPLEQQQYQQDDNYISKNTTTPQLLDVVQEEGSQQSEHQEQQDNFRFTCHNVCKDGPIPFPDDTFDYVQQTLTTLAYKEKDWKNVLQELKRVTKPGGYIQLLEVDLYPQPLEEQGGLWRDQIHSSLKKERDLNVRVACELDSLLTELDLDEITTRFVSVPIGSWGLDIGNLWQQNFDAFLESARPFLVEIMQLDNQQYKKNCKAMKQELKDEKVKAFNNVYISYGRKK